MENGGVSKTKLRWRNYKMMEEEKRRWGKQGNGIMACNPVPWKDKGKSLMGGSQRLKKISMSRAWYGVKASSTCNCNTNWYTVSARHPPSEYRLLPLAKHSPLRLGLPFLLQGIFPTQGSNPGLLHCRQILYHLNHQGSLGAPANKFACFLFFSYCSVFPQSNLLSLGQWT